jgi:hypothetical protein
VGTPPSRASEGFRDGPAASWKRPHEGLLDFFCGLLHLFLMHFDDVVRDPAPPDD